MLRSPGKQFGSNPELAHHTRVDKRKREDDFSECFDKFTKEITGTLTSWKSGFEKELFQINDNLNNIIRTELSKIAESSQEMKNEIASLRNDYVDINKSINNLDLKYNNLNLEISTIKASSQFVSDQYDDIIKRMEDLSEVTKKLSSIELELLEVKKQNKSLKLEINSNDQRERLLNVEIIGIPESKDENLLAFVTEIGKKVGVDIAQNDILHVHRVTPRTKVQGRPRVIIAKLSSRLIKDNLISCMRKHRLLTDALGFPGVPKPIYVNEHLTIYNKHLLKICKDTAKLKQYQYVWLKNGRIAVRKNDTSPAIRIFSEEDVKKIA